MKLTLPPALVAFATGFVMWGLDYLFPLGAVTFSVERWVYQAIFGVGIAIGMLGLIQFMWKRTTIDPHHPQEAKVLITSGIYRFSRNPMYLALVICLVGFGLKLAHALTFLLVPVFIIYMNHFQIKPEEEVLEEKFGEEYRQYKAKVRRWF